MSSKFLPFKLFCVKWWHLAHGKFFSQNSIMFPRYWGLNFGPFRAKSDSLNEIATLKANVCIKNIVEAFFHFLKIWVELYKKKQILTFLCLLLSRNHGPKPQKAEFLSNFETSYLPWPSLAHTFFWFLWKPCRGTNTLWPGTEWSLKIQFLLKNCFATQPIMAAALGLVQNVNTL